MVVAFILVLVFWVAVGVDLFLTWLSERWMDD